jgi:hypothetical protein
MSSLLVREDLIPMVVGYLLVMGALAVGLRLLRRDAARAARGGAAVEPSPAPAVEPGAPAAVKPGADAAVAPSADAAVQPGAGDETASPSWPRLIRHLLTTAIGGYLVLMAVIVGYYFGVHSVHALVTSALSGCGLLLGLSTPVFLALSWLRERRDRRRHPLKPAEASQD